jgi:hemolysin activation/secretion protein
MAAAFAQAPTPPGAGEAVRDAPPPPPLKPAPPTPAPRPAAPAPSTEALQGFELKEVRFPKTEAVPNDELQAVAAPYVGRHVTPADLARLAQALQQLYERRGYALAAIAFPSQDVTRGTLAVAIVEPRLGRIGIVSGQTPPVSDARTLGMMSHAGVRPGRLLSLHALDRAMFALNDLPGVAAKATLAPSGDEGVFDLSIESEPRRAWDLALDADNHGSKATGTARVGALARWNNPSGIGDNVDLRLFTAGSGLTLGRLAYEAPLGATPWRGSLGASRVGYELGAPFTALDASGVATVWDAAATYPLIRSHRRNLILRVALEHKDLEDRFDALGLRTDKTLRSLVAGASYENRDELGGGGFTGAALQVQAGRLRIDTPNVRAEDAALGRQATQGDFAKVGAQASRLQALTRRLSLYAGLTAQWASRNLDGAEKITLGGARAVRAYPAAESPADQALLASGELRWFVDPRWTMFVLYDWARGELRKRPDAGADNTRRLHGSGLGLYFSDARLFTLKASLAWRGSEAPQSESGNDRPRLFMQLQRAF